MGPNDQYQYYYGGNMNEQNSGQSNDYTGYQSRSNQYSQHTRQASNSTPVQNYPNYQLSNTTYGGATDQSQSCTGNPGWYSSNARDGSQRAAETLSRLGTTAPTYPATMATATATASYSQPSGNSYGASYNAPAASSQYASTGAHNSTSASLYGTAGAQASTQARPSSVNSTRSTVAPVRSPVTEPKQNTRQSAGMQQYHRAQLSNVQRAASPAQIQASQQLQRMQADKSRQESVQSLSAMQQTYVDPSAVYDAWPEQQRKLAAAHVAREVEERATAEREAELKRQAEAEAAVEAEKLEAERIAKRHEAEEQEKAEAAQRRAAVKDSRQPPKKKARTSKENKVLASGSDAQSAASASGVDMSQLAALASGGGEDAESQIRSLMALVKTMNDKHPSLLAKIWEEERQDHMQKSSTMQSPVQAGATTESTGSLAPKRKKRSPKKSPSVAQPETAAQIQEITTPVVQAANGQATPTAAPIPKPASVPKTAKQSTTSGTTIWPPEKKGLLAATAAKWLTAMPENRGLNITPDQVSKMLDKNPTYIQLCEMIESNGLKLERASFARALLSGVPDVNSNRSAASPAIPPPPAPGTGRTASTTPVPKAAITSSKKPATSQASTLAVQPSIDSTESLGPISPYYDAQGVGIPTSHFPPPKINRKQVDSRKDLPDTKPERPSETPGPVTKEEAARKRTFADLVDLTSLSDEDDLPPAKQAYLGPPPPVPPEQYRRGAYTSGPDYLPDFDGVVDPYLQKATSRTFQQQQQQQQQQQNQFRPGMMSNSMESRLQGVTVAQPMDKKNVMRRSRYDTKTLARDVLLATGKHPDLLPLNGHLESLRTSYPNSVNLNTDLSTLRWDLIDPGDPVPAALEFLVNDDADSVVQGSDGESDHGMRTPFEQIPASQAVATGRRAGEYSFQITTSTSGYEKASPSRGRGRGRGRASGLSRFSTGGAQTPVGSHAAGDSPTPATPATPGSGGSGYGAFARAIRPDGTKQRGRPVGWRKNLHQKGVGSAGGTDNAPTSGSRPDPATAMAKDPNLPVFKCQWRSCAAELQNLDTLRRHIFKIHGAPTKSGKYTCLWSECGKRIQALDVESGTTNHSIQPFNFPDVQELMKHVEISHIGPVAWRLGDGPPGGFANRNASDSEPYLSDSRGRRVTPTIEAAPPGSAPTPATRQPGQRGRPPKKSEEEKARETQAELARRKREIGLGVDREGATFANEKRRAGFVDDEDGKEVVLDVSD